MVFRRKKPDFRPDFQRRDLVQRLYLSPQQQRRYLKWFLLSVLSVLMLVLQDVLFARMSLFGGRVDTVPAVLLMICVIHGAEGGALFMLLGALVYWFSGSAPGVYVILLIPVLGTVAAAFRQAYLRKGFRTTLMCTATALALYEMLNFLASLLLGVTRFARVGVMVISTGLSLLTLPLMFVLVWGICKIGGDAWKE